MCFSAEASFLAAGATGASGAIALSLAQKREERALAAMPLFFAVQQTAEGLLWRELPLPAGHSDAELWTYVFLMFALVFWPVYAPLSVFLIEREGRRRQWMALIILAGVVVSLYFLWSLADHPQTATIGGAHIVYSGDPSAPIIFAVLYPLATCGAAALSSHRLVRTLGVVLLLGGFIAYYAYWHAFTSVWCFFAAVASVVIVFQFELERRQRESETLGH
jgi:hypothetical protein